MDKIMENNFFFSFNVHQCNFADNVAFIYFLGGAGGGWVLSCRPGERMFGLRERK